MILEVIGVLTIRYYHSILPTETALMLGGFVIIAIAWLSIRYLKLPRNGITFETDELKGETESALSSMVISQATSQMKAPDSSTRFGGGESGGGGAGGSF